MPIITVTDANFTAEAEQNPNIVLLDFYADWCGPCKLMAPILESVSNENYANLTVAKLNVDDNPDTAKKFGIMSIPTLVVLKSGKEITRLIGTKPKQAIIDILIGLGVE
jgi:thioredoxin